MESNSQVRWLKYISLMKFHDGRGGNDIPFNVWFNPQAEGLGTHHLLPDYFLETGDGRELLLHAISNWAMVPPQKHTFFLTDWASGTGMGLFRNDIRLSTCFYFALRHGASHSLLISVLPHFFFFFLCCYLNVCWASFQCSWPLG